jgi:hypothetical protein
MASTNGVIFPESMAYILANRIICFISMPAKSTAPAVLLTVKIRQPSHEFTFGVGMSFIPYPLVLTPMV